MSALVLLAIMVVPMFIASFIFRAIPGNDAEATGTFAGIKFKLTGGVAAYFVLAGAAGYLARDTGILKPPPPVWHVRGTLQLEPAAGDPPINCVLLPPSKPFKVAIDRSFDFEVPMPERSPFPHFFFTAPGYVGESVTLADAGRIGNYRSHMENTSTLVFDEPIVLRRAAAAVPQVAAATGGTQ